MRLVILDDEGKEIGVFTQIERFELHKQIISDFVIAWIREKIEEAT